MATTDSNSLGVPAEDSGRALPSKSSAETASGLSGSIPHALPHGPHIELIEGGAGLQCDNPNCDWADPSVTFQNFDAWLNHPCPKCGENVLTQEDFDSAQKVRAMAALINSLSKDQLVAIGDLLSLPEEDKDAAPVTLEVHAHKGIHVSRVSDPEGAEGGSPEQSEGSGTPQERGPAGETPK